MTTRFCRRGTLALAVLGAGLLAGGPAALAKPIFLPTLKREINQQRRIWQRHLLAPLGKLQPPAPPCPENGTLPAPFSNCGLPEFPATTLPYPGNMAYWGGHVQTTPHVYVIYWGWGQAGAFPSSQPCRAEQIVERSTRATLKCDPDGAGRYMADYVAQLGGTRWAGTQSQYYQTAHRPSGQAYRQHITNPRNQLAGIWVDDANPISGLAKTSATNPAGASNTYTDLAAEAARAAKHFHVRDLANADFVVAQPPNYSDPNAVSTGYCAFHDYTYPGVAAGIYNGITPKLAYTNMPYSLAVNSNGANVCGENAVNSGSAGKLDGFSIVLGHEIEETVTDPGAEDIIGRGTTTNNLGGWYDPLDANENGDKCAWVGESLGLPMEPTVTPIPGSLHDIKGNRGTTFAVQSLWSNQAAEGAGYCAGAGNDLPQPVPAQ